MPTEMEVGSHGLESRPAISDSREGFTSTAGPEMLPSNQATRGPMEPVD